MDIRSANIIALAISLPMMIAFILIFSLVNYEKLNLYEVKAQLGYWTTPAGVFIMIIVIILGIVFHEVIHGITFALFAKAGLKSIRFGILMKSLTPYCHCTEPLKAWQYLISSIMPAIVLGFIPVLVATFTVNIGLLLFGVFFTMAASGDFIIVYMLRNLPRNIRVQDHPEKIGCFVYGE